MTSLHRREWLKSCAWAAAGMGLLTPAITLAAPPPNAHRNGLPVRLTSNENPYGPSLLARKAMAEAIAEANRYPWDRSTRLREAIGRHYGLGADHVLLGAGSSEILGLVTLLASLQKGNAVTADPSFSSWVGTAETLGLRVIRVPLTEEMRPDLPAMLSKMNGETRLFYLCHPNNPTGTVLRSEDLTNAVREASRSALVLLDEAYLEYCDEPETATLVASNRNLVLAKTFSKIHGMAGARIGFALAHPDTLNRLAALQPWANAGASAVSLAGAETSLGDRTFLSDTKKWNRAACLYTAEELRRLGMTVIPSQTNFIYYAPGNRSGDWQSALRTKNILVGAVNNKGWARVTVGTMEEMKQFIAAAASIV